METDEMNFQILQNAANALKPNGKLIFTTLNGLFPLFHSVNERYYVPSEMTWLLKTLNFKTVDILGAKLGAFSRSDKLSIDDFEMLVIATK